ncbi:MAG TPA: Fur family transcriptional regulator [Chloroflexota bacterium]|jgi:Fur family transcriptional regulator, ferric uptake regulator|nr:Fur family transcriptional regulator [Chloroflexota bacterium]
MTSRTHATMEVAVPRGRRSGRKARAAEAPLVSFRTRARDALRAEGYRMTKQRDTLLDVIEHAEGHLDADGIYDLARKRDPRISLSTVYRTLNLLKHHDLVDELHLSEEHHHYEPKSGRPQHYHLVCVDCGGVQEVSGGVLDSLKQELQRERGFAVTGVQLDVQGHCGRCPA